MKAFVLDVLRLCVWLVILMAIFVPLERRFGLRRRQKLFRKAFGVDVALYFLSSLLPKLLLVAPLTLLAGVLHSHSPGGFYEWVGALPFWLRVSAAFVVGEVGAYWGHRWSHESPLLWRFHAVHHQAEEMDWLVHTRAHPVDILFTRLCGFVPIYLLGLAQPLGQTVDLTPAIVTIVATIWGFFIHANLDFRLGWLEWLLASPAFHHWHHSRGTDAASTRNFSPMLP